MNIILKLYSSSCGRNINLSSDIWVMISIKFEVPSQPFHFYLQVANMVNVALHSHKLLAISLLGYLSYQQNNITPLTYIYFILLFIYFPVY